MSRLVSRRVFGLLGIVLITAAVAFPLGVLASHQFTDVPDSNSYHADIDAIADAGVTTGCGNGTTYCPSAFVTREQMAAFMNRLGALAPGKTPVVNATKLDGLNSTQFARSDVELSGTAECGAAATVPATASGWATDGTSAYATTAADAHFFCEVNLPDGATITEVRWDVRDATPIGLVACYLNKAAQGNYTELGVGLTDASGVPNETTLTDSTVDGGVVDAAAYNYYSKCVVTDSGADTAFFGVAVDYTVPGLPMP